MADREQPLVSIDVLAVRVKKEATEYALHRREFEPYAGSVALPGVLLLPGERVADAAKRALLKIGVKDAPYISHFGVFDETNRDPRGATISLAHIAVVKSDAESSAEWGELWHEVIPTLPFDHNAILDAGLDALSSRLWRDWDFTRAVLDDPFTTSGAISLSRALDAMPAERNNFVRWLESSKRFSRSEDQSGFASRDTRWEWL